MYNISLEGQKRGDMVRRTYTPAQIGQNQNHLKGMVRKIIVGIAVLIVVPVIAACSSGGAPEPSLAHGKAMKLGATNVASCSDCHQLQ